MSVCVEGGDGEEAERQKSRRVNSSWKGRGCSLVQTFNSVIFQHLSLSLFHLTVL